MTLIIRNFFFHEKIARKQNVSILNRHNFGPERRTEIIKKKFEVRNFDFVNL